MDAGIEATDTIVAAASAQGVGALAVVRVSGVAAGSIASRVLRGELPPGRRATRKALRRAGRELLDDAMVIRYEAPHSYTGENLVEFVCHGGWVTPVRVVAALVEAGARPALPGEFTRRAVLNGKLDLLQAEAVNDLIRAESTASARLALGQLDGGLSRRISVLREQILGLEALMAYEIDFPEEDDGPLDSARVESATRDVVSALDGLVATAPIGELVRQGALVVIIGAPNVGKSSLFNALLGRNRALVTEIPGTTRDALDAVLDVSPIPLRLVDTAGLRDTTDVVEAMGVAVSRDYLTRAHVVLACGDSMGRVEDALEAARATPGAAIPVLTKCDLHGAAEGKRSAGVEDVVRVSALSGEGLTTLISRVGDVLIAGGQIPDADTPVVSHARYRSVLLRASAEIAEFQAARQAGNLPSTVSAVHLREAVRILEELIGVVDVEDVLGRVFSTFCVGK
ncbi:MAG: tRNA uridine-5-carboxymethylaminomethyl(34) synthesis GTPase MnmE [Gemmatimonadaceae bacterium]